MQIRHVKFSNHFFERLNEQLPSNNSFKQLEKVEAEKRLLRFILNGTLSAPLTVQGKVQYQVLVQLGGQQIYVVLSTVGPGGYLLEDGCFVGVTAMIYKPNRTHSWIKRANREASELRFRHLPKAG